MPVSKGLDQEADSASRLSVSGRAVYEPAQVKGAAFTAAVLMPLPSLSQSSQKKSCFKKSFLDLACVAQWIERWPVKHRVTGSIPSQGTCWVVGQVPSRTHERGNHTLMFLSLYFSLPSSLSKNK